MACYIWQSLCLVLVSLLVLCVSLQANDVCTYEYHISNDPIYSYVYLKMEETLTKDHKRTLEKLRAAFMRCSTLLLDFTVTMTVKDIKIQEICNWMEYYEDEAFCPIISSDYNWTLCGDDPHIHFNYGPEASQEFIAWMSYFHGNLLSYVVMINWNYHGPYYEENVAFNIDQLKCNPSINMIKCVLSELFSWVKVYSEAGGIPQSWDRHQKGSVWVKYEHNDNIIRFINWRMDNFTFAMLCIAEYVFVSLSLALVLAKFFPTVHSQFVTRAATLEFQSLYWGTAVVSNLLVYGLFFITSSILSVIAHNWSNPFNRTLEYGTSYLMGGQVVVSHMILFIGSIVASVRSRNFNNSVPIPSGMAGVVINVSFCFTCFCCCFCCSQRCRAKVLQVLVMYSFMAFIFHSVLEAIAFGFILFDETSRTTTVTLTMLYISLILFLVVLVSFSLILLSRGQSRAFHQQVLTCCGNLFTLLTVFCAVVLLVVMYMIIFFSLNLTGFKGIVTGLVPSISLSLVTWYIKKKIDKDQAQNSNRLPTEYVAINTSQNTQRSSPNENSADATEHTTPLV